MEVKAEYRAIFSEEAADQLREWEESLLALEKSPGDSEQVNRMFRAVHTLKGGAGFIGYDELAGLAHSLESSLQDVREGASQFDATAASFLFEGLDLCRSMIDAFTEGRDAGVDASDFLSRLSAMKGKDANPRVADPKAPAPNAVAPKAAATRPRQVGNTASEGATTACRLSIAIEGLAREAYIRSFLVKNRLERLGRIVSEDPSPDSLKDGTGPFTYAVTLETALDPAALAGAISIDQVTVALGDSDARCRLRVNPPRARCGLRARRPPCPWRQGISPG